MYNNFIKPIAPLIIILLVITGCKKPTDSSIVEAVGWEMIDMPNAAGTIFPTGTLDETTDSVIVNFSVGITEVTNAHYIEIRFQNNRL